MICRKLQKKDLERHLLEKFISNETLGLRVKSIEDGGEPPDFVVHEWTKDISVELTRLIHPKLIEAEAFQGKIVEAARVRFKDKYDANLRVLVEFANQPIKCKASEVIGYTDTLLALVEKVFLCNKDFKFRVTSRRARRPVNHFIETISISNEENFENWQPFGAFLVKNVDVAWLREVIGQKSTAIPKYKYQFHENWLLLVANFGHESSTHGFDFIENEKFGGPFDKVYLYTYRDNSVALLKG